MTNKGKPAGADGGLPTSCLVPGGIGQPEDSPNAGAPQNSVIAAAIKLASVGLHVFPTAAADPKRPITRHGCKDATVDAAEIRRLWRASPTPNIGVATGSVSGAFVLDVDRKPPVDGIATVRALVAHHGPLPKTWTTATPSGGFHLWFRQPEGRRLRSPVGFLPGLDIRAEGASAVVPPSKRPDGRPYGWIRAPWDGTLADAPDWLLILIDPPPKRTAPAPIRSHSLDQLARYAATAVNGECRDVATMAAGGRNVRLFQAAARIGELVGAGLVPLALAEAELEAAADACGLLQDDGRCAVLATIKSGMSAGLATPRAVHA